MIIAMAGLPGTGKSTLACALSGHLPALVLNKDTVRAALFPPPEIEYSNSQDDFVINIILQLTEYYFQKDAERCIILDGRTFSKKAHVDTLVSYSQQYHREVHFIYCTCSDEVARKRIERDLCSGNHPASDRDFALYLRLKADADSLQLPHLRVNTDQPLEDCLQQCLEYLCGNLEQI